MSCPKPSRCALTSEQSNPMEWQNGFCVDSNGGDVNDGVKQLSYVDVRTSADQKVCQDLCTAEELINPAPLTACEGIHSQSNKGCYAHFSTNVARGNGGDNHFCALQKQDRQFVTKVACV